MCGCAAQCVEVEDGVHYIMRVLGCCIMWICETVREKNFLSPFTLLFLHLFLPSSFPLSLSPSFSPFLFLSLFLPLLSLPVPSMGSHSSNEARCGSHESSEVTNCCSVFLYCHIWDGKDIHVHVHMTYTCSWSLLYSVHVHYSD